MRKYAWWILTILLILASLGIYGYKNNESIREIIDKNINSKKQYTFDDPFLLRLAKGSDDIKSDYLLFIFFKIENCQKCFSLYTSLAGITDKYPKTKLNVMGVFYSYEKKSDMQLSLDWINIQRKYGMEFQALAHEISFSRYSDNELIPHLQLYKQKHVDEYTLVYQSINSDSNDVKIIDLIVGD